MLEDYRINEQLQYADHRLVVRGTDVTISGVLGAALLSAMIADTEEGKRRSIAIDSEVDRSRWIRHYESEVRCKAWGTLDAELNMLSRAYKALEDAGMSLTDLCPNILWLDMALGVLVSYMHHLTVEIFGTHIWEGLKWEKPFAQWLINASRVETRRQRYLHTDWTNAAEVIALAERPNETEEPTLVFEGESAEDIQKRYFTWVWKTYQAQVRELPGENPKSAQHRNNVVSEETVWSFLEKELDDLSDEQLQLWKRWMASWETFIRHQLKPEKPVRFWTDAVSEEQKEQLILFLRAQETEWDHYKCLSAAIYSLRQLGYVRRACSLQDITRWMSEHLVKDYTQKNSRSQFYRAWKEHGRYTSEVKYFVRLLHAYGISSLTKPDPKYEEEE